MNNDAYYRSGEDLTFKPTTHEEEKALFVRAKAGDAEAKELLIKSHLLYVANIARKLTKGQLPEDETLSAANFALVKAFEAFDPAFPNRFSSFLHVHVRGEIARLWQDRNLVSKTNFSDGVPIVSVPLGDDLGDDTVNPDETDHKNFLLKLMEQAKEILEPREKEVVALLYCETPASQSDVARKLRLSRERVRQIFNGALHKLQKEMRRLMNENGIE